MSEARAGEQMAFGGVSTRQPLTASDQTIEVRRWTRVTRDLSTSDCIWSAIKINTLGWDGRQVVM